CPTREAESTVVHVALSVERPMVTETSGFDHVTKIDRQSSAMIDTRRVVDVVVLVQTPAAQASQTLENGLRYECPPLGGCAGQAPRRGGGWRRDVQAGASWTAEKDNARANPQRISALPRLHPLSIGVSGRLLKTAGEPACERTCFGTCCRPCAGRGERRAGTR